MKIAGFCHGARNPYKVVHDSPFFGMSKKIVFFNLKKKLVINLLNLFYSENAYYLRCSCTNPIFGKDLVPEI